MITRLLPRFPSVSLAILSLSFALPAGAQTADPVPVYAFSHLAGPLGGYGNADGTGQAARFSDPTGLAFDSSGNLFVADPSSVRKVTPDGVVTTVLTASSAREAGLYSYSSRYTGIAIDAQDNLLVTDSNMVILRRFPSGSLQIFTGQAGNVFYPYTDGALAQATFFAPTGLAYDQTGNLYVADLGNNIIRKITPQGVVSTFAGTPPEYNHPQGSGVQRYKTFPGSADGTGTSAQFNFPCALAADAAGNLYVADQLNHTIRKITPAGVVSTLAGTAGQQGSTDGTGAEARFRQPSGVTVDPAGNVYVADSGNALLRKITPAGVVTTLAGAAGELATVDGNGRAARFVAPKAIALDRSGRLVVGDGSAGAFGAHEEAGTIRRVTLDGVATTFVGQGGAIGTTDGQGTAARFTRPADIAVDAAGNVFVSDRLNHTIRKISSDGTTSTFAGKPGQSGSANGPAASATFYCPAGLAFDATGNLYVADQNNDLIRRIGTDGMVSTVAGTVGISGALNGPALEATFSSPVSVAVDAAGTVYVGDGDNISRTGGPSDQYGTIRKIAAGTVTTLAGSTKWVQDFPLAPDGVGSSALFTDPTGLAVDSSGNLFVADFYAGKIRKVSADGTTMTLALTDSTGAATAIRRPYGIACDKAGNLYVSDLSWGVLYSISLAASPNRTAGVVTRLAGTDGVTGSADGVGAAVQFNHPSGLEIDNKGTLYVADTENNAIRRGALAGAPVITTQPQSASVGAGGSVQFSVTATGVPTPTYQWYFNGGVFQGATASTLSFSSARTSDAGDYTVVATNALGNVTSAKATLTVTAAAVTPPTTTSNSGGGGGGGAPSWWFLLSLGTLAVFRVRRIFIRPE